MYKCDWINMCGKEDKLNLCCHFCSEPRCKFRCKDKLWECTYKERTTTKEEVKKND